MEKARRMSGWEEVIEAGGGEVFLAVGVLVLGVRVRCFMLSHTSCDVGIPVPWLC